MSHIKGSKEPEQAICRNIKYTVFLLILDTHFTWKLRKPTEWKSRKPMLWGRFQGIQAHSPAFKCVQVQCSSSLLAHTQHLGICGEQSWGVQLSGSVVQRPFPSWEKGEQLSPGKPKAPQDCFPQTTILLFPYPTSRTKFSVWGSWDIWLTRTKALCCSFLLP